MKLFGGYFKTDSYSVLSVFWKKQLKIVDCKQQKKLKQGDDWKELEDQIKD